MFCVILMETNSVDSLASVADTCEIGKRVLGLSCGLYI